MAKQNYDSLERGLLALMCDIFGGLGASYMTKEEKDCKNTDDSACKSDCDKTCNTESKEECIDDMDGILTMYSSKVVTNPDNPDGYMLDVTMHFRGIANANAELEEKLTDIFEAVCKNNREECNSNFGYVIDCIHYLVKDNDEVFADEKWIWDPEMISFYFEDKDTDDDYRQYIRMYMDKDNIMRIVKTKDGHIEFDNISSKDRSYFLNTMEQIKNSETAVSENDHKECCKDSGKTNCCIEECNNRKLTTSSDYLTSETGNKYLLDTSYKNDCKNTREDGITAKIYKDMLLDENKTFDPARYMKYINMLIEKLLVEKEYSYNFVDNTYANICFTYENLAKYCENNNISADDDFEHIMNLHAFDSVPHYMSFEVLSQYVDNIPQYIAEAFDFDSVSIYKDKFGDKHYIVCTFSI
jgi:hypothetical protein